MDSLIVVTKISGTLDTVKYAAAYAAGEIRSVHIDAPAREISHCRKGDDLIITLEKGRLVELESGRLITVSPELRLNGYYSDNAGTAPQFFLSDAEDGGSYTTFPFLDEEGSCGGTLMPVPTDKDGALGKALLPLGVLTAAAGGLGAALIGGKGNYAPVFADPPPSGGLAEMPDGGPHENRMRHRIADKVRFDDRNTTDSHAISSQLLSATDSLNGAVAPRGTFTPKLGKDGEGSAEGTIDWRFEIDDADIDDLAEGQTLTQVYAVTVDDGHGGTATQEVTVTLTGTNDAPVITGGETNGTVSEREDGTTDENGLIHEALGALTFEDVDLSDTHTVSATAISTRDSQNGDVAPRGVFTPRLGKDGAIDWRFEIDDAAIDDLAEGQTLTQVYAVTVDDGHGGTATQEVTVTLTGTNDAPVIIGGETNGAVGEHKDATADENALIHEALGALTFEDVDLSDTHTVSATAISTRDSQNGDVAPRGVFTPRLGKDGAIDWRFEIDDAAIDDLAEGQTLTQVYAVTVDDGHGGTATQEVTVTLTGTNDAPVITGGETNGTVSEREDSAADENALIHEALGALTFEDVDLSDTHTVSATAISTRDSQNGDVAPRGVFTPRLGKDGAIDWRFEIDDAAIDDLAEGQTLTQVYAVTVDDGHGGTATQEVTVTIAGTNDAPVIIGGETNGAVSEREDGAADENTATLEATGSLAFKDVDLAESHTVSAEFVSATDSNDGKVAERGAFVPIMGKDGKALAGGTVDWRFFVNDSDIDALAEGQTIKQTYAVTIDDGHGATASEDVTVTITGRNDAPVADAITGEVGESGPAITLAAKFTDADKADGHSFAIDASGTKGEVVDNGDGTFSYDPNGAFDDLLKGETATDTFTYTVTDSAGATSTKTATVTIKGENEAPVARDVTLQGSQQINMGFDERPDFKGWTVDKTIDGNLDTSFYARSADVHIDRSGGTIPGDDAVAVLKFGAGVRVGSTAWGPTISSAKFYGRAGDTIELQYKFEASGDTSIAVGRLVNARTGRVVRELFNEEQAIGNTSGIQTVTATLDADGEYRFEFRSGSRDDSRGTYVGSTMYVGYASIETSVISSDREHVFDKTSFLSSATDPDGDPVTLESVSATSRYGAKVSIGSDGKIHYDATGGLVGVPHGKTVTDTFEFTVSDGKGGETTATASLEIANVSAPAFDTPLAPPAGDEGLALVSALEENDRDIGFGATAQPRHGAEPPGHSSTLHSPMPVDPLADTAAQSQVIA